MPRPNTGPELRWLASRGSYYIIWFDHGARRSRATGTTDRREAEAALANFIIASHQDNSKGPREPDQISVAEALATYIELRAPLTVAPDRIAHAVEALLPFWQKYTIAQITPTLCIKYQKARGLAPGTVRRELGVLTAAMKFLVADGQLTRAIPVALPPKPDHKDRWLTVNEAARLLNATRHSGGRARHYLPLFILIALYTGARKEAITSLRWSQVDLERKLMDFSIPGRVKTKKARPTLPIPNRLMFFLRAAWKRRSSDDGPVLHLDGKPLLRIDKGFRLAVARAGLKNVTPHTLRHTRGTWLAQEGLDLWKIAGWLGQDFATTQKIYTHHHPGHMDDALKAVDQRRRSVAVM
jgi:integrase